MIESIMYFGIGFLGASLLGLLVIPLVHNRATRLTIRRLEAATPLSIAEIQADKDQLRAEFAMSARRLELTIEQLKVRATDQFSELGKKTEAITLLKSEIDEKASTIRALEGREAVLNELLRRGDEHGASTAAALQEAGATLAKANAELGERAGTIATQRAEMTALTTQVDALKLQLARAESQVKEREEWLARERGEADATGQDHGRRVQDFEARLSEREQAIQQLQSELAAARKAEADLQGEIASARGQHRDAVEATQAESARLQAALAQTTEERGRLEQDVLRMKQALEAVQASDRSESALLRRQITEIAAEVARLTMTLEGPGSPIEAILASEPGAGRVNGAHADGGEQAGGSLADRIRALQSKAARPSPVS